MAVKSFRYTDNPDNMKRTQEDKLKKYGRTKAEGDAYFDMIHGKIKQGFAPFYVGDQIAEDGYTTVEAAEPQPEMLYQDVHCLPPVVTLKDGTEYPLPLGIIAAVINRSTHRVITRTCTCRDSFKCKAFDKNIGCLHIGAATAEEPDSVARHVSKEEAINHVKFALKLGLFPYIGKLDFDNEFWGIWTGDPMFTVCLCCPCCCLTRHTYKGYHPENKAQRISIPEGMRFVYDPSKCLGAEDCGACTRRCPAGANVMGPDGKLRHDATKCLFCGECVSRCQRSAIKITTDDLPALINGLLSRFDGQCGDLGFNGEDYAKVVLETVPIPSK